MKIDLREHLSLVSSYRRFIEKRPLFMAETVFSLQVQGKLINQNDLLYVSSYFSKKQIYKSSTKPTTTL